MFAKFLSPDFVGPTIIGSLALLWSLLWKWRNPQDTTVVGSLHNVILDRIGQLSMSALAYVMLCVVINEMHQLNYVSAFGAGYFNQEMFVSIMENAKAGTMKQLITANPPKE